MAVVTHCAAKWVLVAALLGVAAEPTEAAAEEAASSSEQYRIDAILIHGLERTHPDVVMRELLFDEGDVATKEDVEESVQRLRNLGLFRIAEFELLDRRIPLPDGTLPNAEEDHRVLLITVDERWTLLPFGTFSRGGGTFSLQTGLFDINAGGRYIELGAEYQRFGDTNSFYVWGADPRLFDSRLYLGVSGGHSNRINVFYDDDGALSGGHMRARTSAAVGLNKEWRRWLRTGLAVSYSVESYSLRLVPEILAELEAARGLPQQARQAPLSANITIGRMDSNSFLREGLSFTQSFQIANERVLSNVSYEEFGSELRGFLRLPLRSNLGFRTGLGLTTAERPEHAFFIGGFVVRGFLHRRFTGTKFWYGNVEYRIPSLDTRWVVLQHIGFFDATGVADDIPGLAEVDGASAGLGLRVLSPKIFSFIARIDYAFPVYGSGVSVISFGSGQFF